MGVRSCNRLEPDLLKLQGSRTKRPGDEAGWMGRARAGVVCAGGNINLNERRRQRGRQEARLSGLTLTQGQHSSEATVGSEFWLYPFCCRT